MGSAAIPAELHRLVERFARDRKVFKFQDHKGKQLPKAKTPHEQESLQRQIAATDTQIDALVYELYGEIRGTQQMIIDTAGNRGEPTAYGRQLAARDCGRRSR